ncbi:MAG: hypothetical protein KDJ37_01370 [Hyphomicrobiaceae bacterium]|nr:hypothetical protein [Hyphomicrobiaceae bacterium]
MKRLLLSAAVLAALGLAVPVTFSTTASAAEVAGRPALPTTSTDELIKMREKWGTAPSK